MKKLILKTALLSNSLWFLPTAKAVIWFWIGLLVVATAAGTVGKYIIDWNTHYSFVSGVCGAPNDKQCTLWMGTDGTVNWSIPPDDPNYVPSHQPLYDDSGMEGGAWEPDYFSPTDAPTPQVQWLLHFGISSTSGAHTNCWLSPGGWFTNDMRTPDEAILYQNETNIWLVVFGSYSFWMTWNGHWNMSHYWNGHGYQESPPSDDTNNVYEVVISRFEPSGARQWHPVFTNTIYANWRSVYNDPSPDPSAALYMARWSVRQP